MFNVGNDCLQFRGRRREREQFYELEVVSIIEEKSGGRKFKIGFRLCPSCCGLNGEVKGEACFRVFF